MQFYFPSIHSWINLDQSDITPAPEKYLDGSYLPFSVNGVVEQIYDPLTPEIVMFAVNMTKKENAVALILRDKNSEDEEDDEEVIALHGICSRETFKELCKRFFENF